MTEGSPALSVPLRDKKDFAFQIMRLALLKIEAGNLYPVEVAKAALADIGALLGKGEG